jgi:hypothetical protein
MADDGMAEGVTRNILGDRAIEWRFVEEHLPDGPGRCLDFGPGGSTLATTATQRGLTVTAIDRDISDWRLQDHVALVHADIFMVVGPSDNFDVIINCSTIEHVGIPGRYGITLDNPRGDILAMELLRDWLCPGGMMLLTLPLGRDAVFAPKCRVYGAERLPRLLDGYAVEVERCYVKNEQNQWTPCSREIAVAEEASVYSNDPAGNLYALGCFVLRKPE